ncbi:MAG: hypothetical protein RLZZ15_851, partial [Verrucomicrobiota bacterium]
YFSGRTLAGPQFALLPGYFDGPEHERELIARWRDPSTALIVLQTFRSEIRPDLPLRLFAPRAFVFWRHEFSHVRNFGRMSVWAPGRRAPSSRPVPPAR